MSYDDWKTHAPDPGTVEDACDECGVTLFPEERANGRCQRCYADYLSQCGDDEAYERWHEKESA